MEVEMHATNPPDGDPREPLSPTSPTSPTSPMSPMSPVDATVKHPEVLVWFTEMKRLIAESEDRFWRGEVVPALSSLVAVGPVHELLVERCSELASSADALHADDRPVAIGMYL